MRYVENNLTLNEHIVAKAKVSWTVVAVVIFRALFWALIGYILLSGFREVETIDLTDFVGSLPPRISEWVSSYLGSPENGEILIRNGTEEPAGGAVVSLQIKPMYLFAGWCALILFQVIYRILSISAVELAVTEKKIVGKTGIIRTHSVDAFLEKIDYFKINESLWGRIFNFSEIEIGTTSSRIRFRNIEYAVEFRNTVMDCVEARKSRIR